MARNNDRNTRDPNREDPNARAEDDDALGLNHGPTFAAGVRETDSRGREVADTTRGRGQSPELDRAIDNVGE
jgi:hypothetical protein